MTTNYTLTDLEGIAVACLLFPALTLFPGYLLAHALNFWQFRNRTAAFQLAASVPLSIGVGPIITFFTARFAWPLYICITITAVVVLFRNRRPQLDKTFVMATLIGLLWSLFAAVWLSDWQFGSRLYFPTYALDYATRAAMVHSLSTFGLPAQTPFLNPGHAVALHYHFLWLLQCSLIAGPARLTFIAGAIWCGLGLMCVAALAMRILVKRKSWLVVGLLAVTGLDIIPALLLLAANRLHLVSTLPPSVEWWNDQVDGFVYTVFWEPHYICALIACITGFLVVWQSRRLSSAIVAALCFATAVGSGSFVALVFAGFLAVWMILNWRDSLPLAFTGLLTFVFSISYLKTLQGSAQNVGGSLFQLTVRAFSPFPMPPLVNLMVLPLNYFLELGFFAACVWIGYRRKLEMHERALLVMASTAIFVCTFVKSGATPNNDLGWRGFLVAQFALLILSAAYLEMARPLPFLRCLLFLGLLGTAYDLALTRLFPILSDANRVPKLKWLAHDQRLGERTLSNRDAYVWLQQHSSPSAILAQNPDVAAIDLFSGLYADRRIVAGDQTCTIGFGGTTAECQSVMPALFKLFHKGGDLEEACRVLPASFYVVKDTDEAWSQDWGPAAFSNAFVRIYTCKSAQR